MTSFSGAISASFDETDWTLIGALADSNAEFAEAAMARLLRDYWTPIFAYIRRSGYSRDNALDLTQEFIATVILGRGLFRHANRERGRFRALIKTSIRNFLTEQHRHDSARKRFPVTRLYSLSTGLGMEEPADFHTPEAAFDYQLATTAIQRALTRTREYCLSAGMSVHAMLLEDRYIKPLISGDDPPEYEELAEKYELRDARQASNLVAVARNRFRRELRTEVARWVQNEEQVDDELQRLVRAVSNKQRGPKGNIND